MPGRRRRPRDAKNLTDRYAAGEFDVERVDEEDVETAQRFSERSRNAQQNKILRTALLRAEEQADLSDIESLPVGQVEQVYSLYCEVKHADRTYLAVVRKTLTKLSETQLVVGDRVRFRDIGATDESGQPEAVIEQILPRQTILTRADSFKGTTQHPIVANAEQMLIVASVKFPTVKWGLIDRMLVAAKSGGLLPIVCLNKLDLIDDGDYPTGEDATDEDINPLDALAHYTSLGIQTLQTSVEPAKGLNDLRESLTNRITVLAGHSGVGKSSLIRAIQPELDIRIGEISRYTAKGRHTTTSARRYALDFGGAVIDTPGVKLFGLWAVSRENLLEFFADVENETAPSWRVQSYNRILASLRE
jgi:ribosome biogenesis GTPase